MKTTVSVRSSWRGMIAIPAIRASAMQGVIAGTEHLRQASRAVAPIEEGTLERSAQTTYNPGNLEGAVSYNTPYAVKQHEDLTLRHDAGRTAKYLENPLNGERAKIIALIAAAIKRAL